MMARLKWDLDPPSPNQLKKNVVKLTKLSGSAQFNFNRAGSDALHACVDPEHFVRGGSERGPKCH